MDLSGAESAIRDSESGDSNRAIPRSRLNIDRLRFGLAILTQFPAILLFIAIQVTFVLLPVEILAIPGLRFW